MYGKLFASAFTGSLIGAGSDVYAVWAYVIAHSEKERVELNPTLLSVIIGTSAENIEQAIEYLCSPDPKSRSTAEEGRRLIREGQFQYFVVNHAIYRALRNEDERREYNRERKRKERERKNCH